MLIKEREEAPQKTFIVGLIVFPVSRIPPLSDHLLSSSYHGSAGLSLDSPASSTMYSHHFAPDLLQNSLEALGHIPGLCHVLYVLIPYIRTHDLSSWRYLLAMKKFTLSFLFAACCLSGFGQNFVIDTVYFGYNRYGLSPESKVTLDSLASQFVDFPNYYVEIFGHTDSTGTDEYNLVLSEQRAREVAVYLIGKGAQVERVNYEGLGTTKPAESNRTHRGRSINRRVDVAVLFTEVRIPLPEPPVDSSKLNLVPVVTIDPASLIDTIYCDYAQFPIASDKSYRIITPKGTEILIPMGAFETESEELQVTVKELFKTSEYLMAKMPLIAKNGPIECPGMLSFAISDGRRPVDIVDETKFEISLPTTRREQDISVYKGTGGGRGGRRNRRSQNSDPGADPMFAAPTRWTEQQGTTVRYLGGRKRKYQFDVSEPSRYAVGRILYYPMNTERNDKGFDMMVKIKGKRWPRTTHMLMVGENIKTSIPFKKKGDKLWESRKIKFVDDKAPMILFALQYDEEGSPWVINYKFRVVDYVKKGKGKKALPVVKMKLRFKQVTEQELQEILIDLDN